MLSTINGVFDLDAPLRDLIFEFSRQNRIGELSPWFTERLDHQIKTGWFQPTYDLDSVADRITHWLVSYRIQTGKNTVVLGMSGGVDSALTAALFKRAGYRVIGVTMPIHQNPEETERGQDACRALGIEHVHKDLTRLYDVTIDEEGDLDSDLQLIHPTKEVRIRRGNIRARLRMITLYNLSSATGGVVASTDNLSELGAAFFTIFGDQGDVAPIQSLTKSWEVPYLAMKLGVPEHTWRATPTDGLGVDVGDEAQLGCSYLEWDIMVFEMSKHHTSKLSELRSVLELTDHRAEIVFDAVTRRMGAGWFKRMHPININHPTADRFGMLSRLDQSLFRPDCVK